MNISYKDIMTMPLDVDNKTRRVKIVISEMGSKDLDNDIIEAGAYDKTIAERGPKGANIIHHLIDHNPSYGSGFLSTFSELYTERNQLIGVSNLPETTLANDTMKLYEAGLIKNHSVGFQTMQSIAGKGDEPRRLTQLKLYEGSAVLWGANPNTPTISVGKGVFQPDLILMITKQMMLVSKEIKDGKYTDEGFSLLQLYIKQLEDFAENTTTQAAVNESAPGPDKSQLFAKELYLLTLTN
jgi:HK97 family phage prohead protease